MAVRQLAMAFLTAALPLAAQAPPAASPAPAATPAATASPAPAPPSRGAEALRLFGKLEDDRALVYIASGPPDARKSVACPDAFRPLEVWTYLEHPTLGKNAQIIFFPESGTNEYRYWTVLDGEDVLLSASRAGKRPFAEIEQELVSSCPDAALVANAFHAISARQKDNNGGLAERGAQAVPHFVAPKGASPEADAPKPVLVSNKPLSGHERKKLTQALPESYRKFLEDVEPILTDLERDTFLKLTSDYQRDRFVENFWKRRSLGPDGMRIAFRDIYMLRLAQVKERYRNINTDQGRIFLVNGPPDSMRKIECDEVYWPMEIWYYERIERLRLSKVLLLFYRPFGMGDYKLWTPIEGPQALLVGSVGGLAGASMPRNRTDITRCMEWREINAAVSAVSAIFGQATALKMEGDLKEGEKPDVEGVDAVLLMTTDLDTAAAKLPVQRLLRFPEMVANKMRLELVLVLERDSLTQKKIGDETFFDVDVVGEVVKGERLVDNFRYRFDFPTSTVNGAFVPLTIERELYPGDYQIKVKVADANRNAGAVLAEKLKVPEVPDAPLSAEEKAAREAARAAVTRLSEGASPVGSLSFVPLALEIATGLVKFETRATSKDIAFTEFYLDDRRVVTKRRAPFDADLDLGELPRKHTVKVIGYAKDGRAIAEDQMILNEGREAFRVRITAPDKGARLEGPTRVVADIAVPETKKLKSAEVFVNESRVATLYQPPFQQVVDVPKSKDLGFIRVVATLEDGTATEDLRYYNAPKYLSEVNVQAVELYTSVFQHGKPVTGLMKENFRVLEDGVPQTLDGFEVVKNLPLSLGIGIDTSGSMEESIVDAQKAASEFLKDVMTPKDRCFLVTFDNEPQLVSRFTTDRDRLAQAMAGLRAQGSTALWDAIVYGLYQFQGIRGRKAYVVLTDGEDRNSKFTFDAALDYAKKSGAAIYFIGLKIGAAQLDVRYKLNRMAKETGGTVYHVDSAKNLKKIYAEIDEELRSQYLLSYVPQNKTAGGPWRKVEVKMTPDNLTARTVSGYYP